MRTWTESAKSKLDDHLKRVRESAEASGADPIEVEEDIRRHIDEVLGARKIEAVTAEDVDIILKQIGAPESRTPNRDGGQRVLTPQIPAPVPKKTLHPFLLFFGVILPVFTALFELGTRMSAAIFVDPMPDVWHSVWVFSVPLINGLSWWALKYGKTNWLRWLGIASGFVIGILVYYAAIYVVLSPFALVAIIFYGIGLLPLTPLFALLSALRLRSLLKRNHGNSDSPLGGFGIGFSGAVLALILTAIPIVLTRHWSEVYVSGSPDEKTSAIQWLRAVGREHILLSDCYATEGRGGGPFGMHLQGKPVATDQARSIYYRVTGRPFNSTPPPQHGFSAARWNFLDEMSWDDEAGGTIVGGRLKGLSLAQSRMDGLLNADAAWSYVEWTMEFNNVATTDREARAQVQLPPGGVVSRLTLWVNGEEREAAFASCGQVREAYQQVVQVQRRDPVLVTSSGPDRVLVQCFPVPRAGGTIKIRMGITAPLHLEGAETALLVWPHFIERNFLVAEHVKHSLWLEAKQPLQAANSELKAEQSKPGMHGLRGQLPDAALAEPSSMVRIRRDTAVDAVWVTDHHGSEGQFIRQIVQPQSGATPARVIFVIDGSIGMKEFRSLISEAIKNFPDGIETAVLLASDAVEEISPIEKSKAAFPDKIARRLERVKWTGGQDNLPALIQAWDLAAEKPGSVVVWIHGPQPQLLEDGEQIEQRVLWRFNESAPVIHELQTSAGPDLIVQRFYGKAAMASVARFGTVREDLLRLFAAWNPDAKRLALVRERHLADSIPLAERGKETSKHISRLWANDEVRRMIAGNKRNKAVELASKYQLVTPVSGAVVLETKQQFDQAGLQPVNPETVPVVPEPATVALLLLCGGFVLLIRARKLMRIQFDRWFPSRPDAK